MMTDDDVSLGMIVQLKCDNRGRVHEQAENGNENCEGGGENC